MKHSAGLNWECSASFVLHVRPVELSYCTPPLDTP